MMPWLGVADTPTWAHGMGAEAQDGREKHKNNRNTGPKARHRALS